MIPCVLNTNIPDPSKLAMRQSASLSSYVLGTCDFIGVRWQVANPDYLSTHQNQSCEIRVILLLALGSFQSLPLPLICWYALGSGKKGRPMIVCSL